MGHDHRLEVFVRRHDGTPDSGARRHQLVGLVQSELVRADSGEEPGDRHRGEPPIDRLAAAHRDARRAEPVEPDQEERRHERHLIGQDRDREEQVREPNPPRAASLRRADRRAPGDHERAEGAHRREQVGPAGDVGDRLGVDGMSGEQNGGAQGHGGAGSRTQDQQEEKPRADQMQRETHQVIERGIPDPHEPFQPVERPDRGMERLRGRALRGVRGHQGHVIPDPTVLEDREIEDRGGQGGDQGEHVRVHPAGRRRCHGRRGAGWSRFRGIHARNDAVSGV